MELAYRYQWVDFYRGEWRLLNPETSAEGKKILLMGDSFTAHPLGYVKTLRDSLPDAAIRNAGIPGTGIRETAIIAPGRLQEFQPEVLVYQVYVGNDLWDIRKSAARQGVEQWRRLYWKAADRSLFLRYLNYKSAQLKTDIGLLPAPSFYLEAPAYAPERYNAREKRIFRAEPALVQNSLTLQGARARDMARWFGHMDALLKALPESTQQVLIWVIPHCAQVSRHYQTRMEAIGAAPFDSTALAHNFPFLQAIRQRYQTDSRVQVYSALPEFQAAELRGEALYYENDPHLNERGSRLCGELLLNRLRE